MQPKIALIYDRVNTPHGGAEQVLLALHEAFPEAPLYTSVYDPQKAEWASVFEIKPSFLQTIPGSADHHRLYAPLMPLAFESFNLDEFDVVISVTSAEAKGIITKPEQLHICYLLTPTRYLHSHRSEYERTHWPFKLPLLRTISKKLLDYLKWWDEAAAARPDVIIPISELVKKRTEKYYKRQTEQVIYPPIPESTETLHDMSDETPESYLLVMSRLVPYKRIDLIIRAAQYLQKPLIIIGEGPAEKDLRSMAGENTIFMGSVSEKAKRALLAQAEAVIMPGIEDFGITAVEATMHGVPVILHADSGAAELLPDKQVAIHLSELNERGLIVAIEQLSHLKFEFGPTKKKLQKYAINKFVGRFRETVLALWEAHQKG